MSAAFDLLYVSDVRFTVFFCCSLGEWMDGNINSKKIMNMTTQRPCRQSFPHSTAPLARLNECHGKIEMEVLDHACPVSPVSGGRSNATQDPLT